MDWTGLPPLPALRAFEAAARHRGYSAAGRELNVTHAAIAQQVRALEAFVGARLVERAGRGLALTDAGARLSLGLTQGFEVVASSVREIAEAEAERPISVTMTPAFAASWFMPRLSLFRAKHPDIELRIDPSAALVDLAAGDCDAAIRFGDGNWPGLETEPLVASNFVIAGTPDLVAGLTVVEPSDLLDLHWLQEIGTDEIARWLAGRGITALPRRIVTEMPGYMMLTALRQGQGIAATARIFIEDDIAEGRLLALFEDTEGAPKTYHLCWRPGIQRPPLRAFLRWIRAEAKADPQARGFRPGAMVAGWSPPEA